MTLAQALALIGVQFAILCGLIAYLWRQNDKRFEKLEKASSESALAQFIARDAEREKHWVKWRDGTDAKLAESAPMSEIHSLRKWKHETVDPYIPGAVNAIKDRVDRIERLLNGKH